MRKTSFVILLLLGLLSCTPESTTPEEKTLQLPKGDYFGETVGTSAKLFAEGIVSREFQELNAVFSPNGNEFYFTLSNPLRTFYTIVFYK